MLAAQAIGRWRAIRRRAGDEASRPYLISTTPPIDAAHGRRAVVAKRRGATDTQADSKPAIAGRVPSIGSTTSTYCAGPLGSTSPRSSE